LISHWDEYIRVLSEKGKDSFKNIEYRNIDSINIECSNVRQELAVFDRSDRSLSLNFYSSNDVPINEARHQRGRNNEVFTAKVMNGQKSTHTYRREKGTTIYGGWIFPHYGHFLTETLSRIHAISAYPNSKVIFDVFDGHEVRTLNKPWAQQLLAAVGVERERILFSTERRVFEKIIFPSQSLILHRGVSTLEQKKIWASLEPRRSNAVPFRKIYISRSRLQQNKRPLINEVELEKLLSFHGFEIIYPERMTVYEQIKVLSEADLLVGPSGTAIHNCVFMKEGTRVISLTTTEFTLINEALCCYPRSQQYDVFFGKRDGGGCGWRIDVQELLSALF